MTSEVQKWCKVGYYIDARDNMNEWCIAEVKEISKTSVKIMLLEWSPKCEVILPLKSPKIAPFRKMSRYNTSQRLRNSRFHDFSSISLSSLHEKLRQVLENNLLLEDAFQTTQFFRGRFYLLTDFFLSSRTITETSSSILSFSLDVLKLVQQWLNQCKSLFPYYYSSQLQPESYLEDNMTALACSCNEIIEIFKRLVGIEKRFGDVFTLVELPAEALKTITPCSGENRAKWTKFFIEKFVASTGFDVILDLVQNEDEKSRVPFSFLNQFPVYELLELIDSPKFQGFYSSFNRAVLKRIEIVSDSELKDLKHEEIVNLLTRLKKFRVLEGNLNIEHMKISFFLKMLKSNYLEKRIKGLTEINSAIESLETRSPYQQPKPKTTADDLKNWLYHSDILKTLLLDRPHIELIKRASVVLKFFAKYHVLEDSELLQLWQSIRGKHDSYIRATYEVLVDLASVLNEQQNNFLFSEFSKVPCEEFDDSFLFMVKDFSVKAITTAKKSINFLSQGKLYGVELFRELLMKNLNEEMNDLAIQCLVGIVAEDISNQIKSECFKLARVLIKKKEVTLQGVVLFLKVTKKSGRAVPEPNDYSIVKEILNLCSFVIDNLAEHLSSSSNQNGLKVEKSTKFISQHLRFLSHNFEKTPDFVSNYLTKIWSLFDNKGPRERHLFFEWLIKLTNLRLNQSNHIFSQVFVGYFLNDEVFPATCSAEIEYTAFNIYFLLHNRAYHILELTDSGLIRFRRDKDLKGLKKLIKIFISTENEDVLEKAGKVIFACLSRFDCSLMPEAKEVVNKMTDYLMNLIFTSRENEHLVTRVLMIFQVLIDKYDDDNEFNCNWYVKVNKEYHPIKINQSKTVRHMRKQLAIYKQRPLEQIVFTCSDKKYTVVEDDLEICKIRNSFLEVSVIPEQLVVERQPFRTLEKNQGLVDLLLELVADLNKTYTDIAWKLLLYLPTCQSLKNSLKELKSPVKELISSSSTYRLLYALNIISKESSDKNWVSRFVKAGGRQFLVQVFTQKEKNLPLKLRAMKELMLLQVLSKILSEIEDPFNFLDSLLKGFEIIAKSVLKNLKIDADLNFLKNMENLINLVNEKDGTVVNRFLSSKKLDKLLKHSIIKNQNTFFVENSCKIFETIKNFSGCLEPLYLQFLETLEFSLSNASHSSYYWETLSQLVKESQNLQVTRSLPPLLLKTLKESPSEDSSSDKNEILSGILQVLESCLIHSDSSFPLEDFSMILKTCLCDFAQLSGCSRFNPKCKHPETRQNCFSLIFQACLKDLRLISQLEATLDPLHQDPSWRSSKKSGWVHSPITKEKSSTGFVGLKNLGCTCYMNSILQQLFMIESFRTEVLSAECPEEEDLMRQLQHIFAGLLGSDKQYINTKNFAKAFKDPEGQEINVAEQMDVDEFFASFMDKVENSLKGTGKAALVKEHFGGVQVTELIGKECPHRSEREEPFLSISVEVKNKRTLLEGLGSYVQEELLEGENSYQCDHCESKVKAIRRVCVKYLPNFLILALRRFEFDFDSMTREKLNDFFEFPSELDMHGFTQEGLEKEKMREQEYYLYSLRGIVIHTGTAEIGHYYSYIVHDGQWIEFNDTWIGLVNAQNIANDCFGGEEKFQYPYSRVSSRERPGNAYMLIYERNVKYKPSDSSEDGIEVISNNPQHVEIKALKEIQNQNKKYWINKITFAQEYIKFFVGLSKLPQVSSKFLVKFFFTVLVRSKEKKFELFEMFQRIYHDLVDKELSSWLLDLISHEKVCKELLLFNPLLYVRKIVVALCKMALKVVDDDMVKVFFTNFIQNLRLARREHSSYFVQYLELVRIALLMINDKEFQQRYLQIILNFLFNNPFELPQPRPHRNSDFSLGYDLNCDEEPRECLNQNEFLNTSFNELYELVYALRDLLTDTQNDYLVSETAINIMVSDFDCKHMNLGIGKLLFAISRKGFSTPEEVLKCLISYLKAKDFIFTNCFSAILGFFSVSGDYLERLSMILFVSLDQIIQEMKSKSEFEPFIFFLLTLSQQVNNFWESLIKNCESLKSFEAFCLDQLSPGYRSGNQEDTFRSNIKTIVSNLESLHQNPFVQPSGDSKIEIGSKIELFEFQSTYEGKVINKVGNLILIAVTCPGSSQVGFDVRDISTDEISVKKTKNCS